MKQYRSIALYTVIIFSNVIPGNDVHYSDYNNKTELSSITKVAQIEETTDEKIQQTIFTLPNILTAVSAGVIVLGSIFLYFRSDTNNYDIWDSKEEL